MNHLTIRRIIFFLSLVMPFYSYASPVLVDTNWLASNKNNKDIVIVDTSDHTQHLRFHIPGAIHIDYSEIVIKRRKDKVSVQVNNDYFQKLLAHRGISNSSHIIIYDDMGGLNAGRLFWQLEQIGHTKVSVLDGGLVKWIIENRKVDNKTTKRLPAQYKNNKTGSRDNLATIESMSSTDNLLIDARSKEEYMGHPKYPRTGHIPGAVLWTWQDNVDFENAFTIKSKSKIEKLQKHVNLDDKNKNIIAYCRSGHRAAQTYLTLRSMGFDKVKLYDGSMAEYSRNKQAPLVKGCTKC